MTAHCALRPVAAIPQAWDRLSHDDHHLLCELPAPHGELFAWLDSQLHEHGAEPWAALREALQGQPHAGFAAGRDGQGCRPRRSRATTSPS